MRGAQVKIADAWRGPTTCVVQLSAALSLAITAPAPSFAQTVCPDAATVSAARLIELEAMMMNVGLRCARVGVSMADHLDDMAGRHQTMFQSARGRLRTYMDDLVAASGPAAAKAPVAAPASAVGLKSKKAPQAPLSASARAAVKKAPPAASAAITGAAARKAARPAPAAATKVLPAAPAAKGASAAKLSPKSAAKLAPKLAPKAAPVSAAKAPQAAPRARHGDPMDRFMTMLGNRYGAGSTSPGRCQSFDAIALSLGEPGSESRLLTMVAESLIGTTLLETLTACAGKN